ncbi:glycoside hydrolase family 31 protein [Bacteroides nordii]|jgi:glycosyl hydrolase, family 31|uniref:glycoside hydrolase family 31 protein n=2 Tax=Bacteroides TaxID=816 RepID=UPI001CBCF2C9|nr:glycoside hydrolase family 31 protein [Bacteroides nordii]UAK41349.1 glycoside hydrolase family 31 protein [Bacteroides nordii]
MNGFKKSSSQKKPLLQGFLLNFKKGKTIICLVALLMLATAKTSASDNNPVANPEAVVICGKARFTVLTPEMIRIEYSAKGIFEDQATFTVTNRRLKVPRFRKREDNTYLYIVTDKVRLKYRKSTNPVTTPASPENLTITIDNNGCESVWYPGKSDSLNLKGTCRTLDGSNGDNKRAEMENGLISRSGWAVIDDSWAAIRSDGGRSYALRPNADMEFDWWAERSDTDALDIYYLGYGNDYKKAISDYTKIAGKIPLPPDYVFGYWYSKYSAYSADDYRRIMSEIKDNKIPADVMILDMDWHWNVGNGQSGDKGGWTGWSWNTNLIPNPKGLLRNIHDNNFKIALNLHPADGINKNESPVYFAAMNSELNGKYLNDKKDNISWSIDYTDFTKSFFKNIIRNHESEGVDFWWIDWQQHLTSNDTYGLSETFWCNHIFFNDMVRKRTDRRPVIFHRWGGLGSHRYQIGFSGDALINFPTLAFQPYFTATASNVGYGYWGHDLGGHAFTDEVTVNNPELLLRWIQFGVFTPIFRTHATNDSRIERRIWKFSNFPIMLKAVRLRYSLFPYIYTMARKTYDTGISICRPLYYEYPNAEEAYLYEGEYFFGDDILVAPITEASENGKSTKTIWFPEGKWWSVATNELIEGPCRKTMCFTQEQIPYFFKQGAIIPYNPPTVMNVTERPGHLILNFVSGCKGEGVLYEDDGDNNDYSTVFATTILRQSFKNNKGEYVITPRQGIYTNGVNARSYTFRIYNTTQPVAVKVNGVETSNYSYDVKRKCTNIDIPCTDCTTEVKVRVVYSK